MGAGSHRRGSLADVFAVTAVAVLFGLPIAGVLAVAPREINNRVKCASNLRQISMATMLYADQNRGKYPRTIYKADAAPTWGTPYQGKPAADVKPIEDADPFADGKQRPAENDVTAAFYLLMRTQDIVSDVYTCPSARLKPWDFGGGKNNASHWTNWTGNAGLAAHLSYSYQNPYPTRDAVSRGVRFDNTLSGEFPVFADMNPGGDAVTAATLRGNADAIRAANSLNHDRDGQNVAFADGHIEFCANPFVGSKRDNLYTANGPEVEGRAKAKAMIAASSADTDDSVLLPTASDIGQKITPLDEATIKRLDAEDAARVAALVKGVQGDWSRRVDDELALRLTLTADRMTATDGRSSVSYGYRVLGPINDTAVVVELNIPRARPTSQPSRAALQVQGDGQLRIETVGTDGAIDGTWTRGRTPPAATSPTAPTSRPTSRPAGFRN